MWDRRREKRGGVKLGWGIGGGRTQEGFAARTKEWIRDEVKDRWSWKETG